MVNLNVTDIEFYIKRDVQGVITDPIKLNNIVGSAAIGRNDLSRMDNLGASFNDGYDPSIVLYLQSG